MSRSKRHERSTQDKPNEVKSTFVAAHKKNKMASADAHDLEKEGGESEGDTFNEGGRRFSVFDFLSEMNTIKTIAFDKLSFSGG